ncbi:MAG TPA: hypothetical protein VGB97_02580 [Candidatus Paceibacterota bacterium]|jgi:hypothetical protein
MKLIRALALFLLLFVSTSSLQAETVFMGMHVSEPFEVTQGNSLHSSLELWDGDIARSRRPATKQGVLVHFDYPVRASWAIRVIGRAGYVHADRMDLERYRKQMTGSQVRAPVLALSLAALYLERGHELTDEGTFPKLVNGDGKIITVESAVTADLPSGTYFLAFIEDGRMTL